jgi:hypothetical protein
MKNKLFRQGDVLLVRVASIPANAVKQKPENGRIILAHGEVTGHHHSVDIDAADWWKNGEDQFIDVKSPTELLHQEHGAVALERGKYRVVRQREYSPEAIRRILD